MSTSTPTRSDPRAVLALGLSVAEFDRIVDPATMVGYPRRDLGLDDRSAG